MSCFVSVPLKKTTKIDLLGHKKHICSKIYESKAEQPWINHQCLELSEFEKPLLELNKLRLNSTCGTLVNENCLDVMTRYYDELDILDKKFTGNFFEVPFKWEDAFDRKKLLKTTSSLSLPAVSFEKACILFNIGAMQSHLACSCISDTKNDEHLKLAAKYFQMASGTFFILSFKITLDNPTSDMRPDTLSALQALMIAQAQECFFFKANLLYADDGKYGIIAKVASKTEELYSEALKLMQKQTISQIWEKEGLSIVESKCDVFHALAEYYQSLVCKSRKDVGEEIARLQKALDLVNSIKSKAVLVSDLKNFFSKISYSYEMAKKDNDYIYHAKIPEYKSLPPVERAATYAKHILPNENRLNPNSQDLFSPDWINTSNSPKCRDLKIDNRIYSSSSPKKFIDSKEKQSSKSEIQPTKESVVKHVKVDTTSQKKPIIDFKEQQYFKSTSKESVALERTSQPDGKKALQEKKRNSEKNIDNTFKVVQRRSEPELKPEPESEVIQKQSPNDNVQMLDFSNRVLLAAIFLAIFIFLYIVIKY